MPLFEVAMIEHPTKEEQEEGKVEKLIMPPSPIIARDPQSAAIKVAMEDTELTNYDPNRLEVLVRPFVEEE